MAMIAVLTAVSLVLTSRSEALAQSRQSEHEIVVRRSYVEACERQLDALEAANRIVDRAEGARDECRQDRAKLERKIARLELELQTERSTRPRRAVWAGAGAGGAVVVLVILALVTR
jgi:hypothetical protein